MKKRSTGRARSGTSLNVSIERANKKLKLLKRYGKFGHYASKELLSAFANEPNIRIDKKSKSFPIKINTSRLTQGQVRYYKRQLDQFLRNKSSSILGIKDIEQKARRSLKDTLVQLTDDQITDEDLEDYYDLFTTDEYKYFSDRIEPSDKLLVLLNEAKSRTEDDFVKLLEQYMTLNSSDARQKAKKLYNKWVS